MRSYYIHLEGQEKAITVQSYLLAGVKMPFASKENRAKKRKSG